MTGEFDTIQSFVESLNNSRVPYLILRNYENMLSPVIYMEGHGDIDLLCSDSRLLAQAIGAKTYINKVKEVCNDGIHYYILIEGQHVSLDLRSVGDGYYCQQWQEDMLERRVSADGLYVMSEEDYFYSLTHHAILQKRVFTGEYKDRLSMMAKHLGIEIQNPDIKSFISLLEQYMKEHDYVYTYPKDIFVPLNTKYINTRLLTKNQSLAYAHWRFDTKVGVIEFLVKVKHFIFGKCR